MIENHMISNNSSIISYFILNILIWYWYYTLTKRSTFRKLLSRHYYCHLTVSLSLFSHYFHEYALSILFVVNSIHHLSNPSFECTYSPASRLSCPIVVASIRAWHGGHHDRPIHRIIIVMDRSNRRSSLFSILLISGAIQVPGSHGWLLAASSRTKILAKNYSKSALIAEETSKIIATT